MPFRHFVRAEACHRASRQGVARIRNANRPSSAGMARVGLRLAHTGDGACVRTAHSERRAVFVSGGNIVV